MIQILKIMFLVQTNIGFCYHRASTNDFYSNGESITKFRLPISITTFATLFEITQEFINSFQSEPYLVITDEGYGIAEFLNNKAKFIKVDNENVKNSTKYLYVELLRLPSIIDNSDEISQKNFPMVGVLSKNVTESPNISLIQSGDNFYYFYSDNFYDFSTMNHVEPLQEYTIIKSPISNNILKIETQNGIVLVNVVDTYSHIIYRPADINVPIQSIELSKTPKEYNYIPHFQYNILPNWEPGEELLIPIDEASEENDRGNDRGNSVKNFLNILNRNLARNIEDSSDDIPRNLVIPQMVFQPVNQNSPEPDYRLDVLATYFAHLYGIPIKIPEFIILNGLRVNFISFDQLREIPIHRSELDPCLQVYAGLPPISNMIVTVFGENGITYLVKARYDSKTEMIYPPI
jgi:hypothetical protein